jgi:dynein heavy chain
MFNLSRLEEISGAASKEYSMEKAIAKMKDDWKEMRFELVPYRETVSILFKFKPFFWF